MDKQFLLSVNKKQSKKESKFPYSTVSKDSMQYKDLLFDYDFSKDGDYKSGGVNLSDAFIMGSANTNSSKPRVNKWRNNQNMNITNEPATNTNTNTHINSGENMSATGSINSINTSQSQQNENSTNQSKDSYQSLNQTQHFQSNSSFPNSFPHPQMIPVAVPMTFKFETLQIDNIYNFNKKINFPIEKPLYYLSYPWQPNSTFGPFSSKQIHDMYNRKQLDGNCEFRPLDIFHFEKDSIKEGKEEFSKLSLINSENWTESIQDSPLLQYTELYSKSIKLLNSNPSKKIDEKAKNVEKIEVPVKKENNFDQSSQKINTDSTVTNNNIIQSEEDEEEEGDWAKVEKKKKVKKDDNSGLVGIKKKKKGKGQDLNVNLGFKY